MNTKTYNTIITSMKEHLIANQDIVTDFNDGSVIMTIFEAFARILDQAYIDTRIGYTNNLRAIPYSVFGFEKKSGSYATVNVIFSRESAKTTECTIESGTRVSDGSHIFVTTEKAIINAGEKNSNSVGATAAEIGLDYNVSANTITTIESNVAGEVVAVNNMYKATGGADEETDTEMLKRFKTYINGLQGTNTYGIKAGVLSIEGVRSIGIEEHFPPKSNIYNFTVYVDDGTGSLTEDLKTKVEDVINGTDSSTNAGLRSAGINVDVQGAENLDVQVEVTCKIYRVETALATSNITTKLQEYINGLGINENVVLSSLTVLLKQISGVTDVSGLTLTVGTTVYTSENIQVGVNQIARFAGVTLHLISE